jgi:broad specificity phosphatase PhoE
VTRLLLWRHGRTAWNDERRTQGQTDVELDEIGIEQAESAAQALAAREPKVLISSDLSRTRRTAQALAELTGLPVRLDARLRERHFGPWQGLTHAEIRERHADDWARFSAGQAVLNPAIEPVETIAERFVAALLDAAEVAGEGGTAVLVTHGGSARIGIGGLLGWPRQTWASLGVLDNCHSSELWRDPHGRWQLVAYNTSLFSLDHELRNLSGPGWSRDPQDLRELRSTR